MTSDSTSTAEREGTIRFRHTLRPPRAGDAIPQESLARLEGWRRVLHGLGLVGRDARRYDGYAFGNLSVRDPAQPARFYITASQAIDAPALDATLLARIDGWNLDEFSVAATGVRPPSSETLTHAMVYAADARARWLFHVHSPAIWQEAAALGLPATGPGTPYGSAALAREVRALLEANAKRPLVFVTAGHIDGVFACGADADDVGCALVAALAHTGLRRTP